MRKIEQCTFCKENCHDDHKTYERFYLPYANETVEVPRIMARCGLFLLDIKGIQLRPNERIDDETIIIG